MTIHHQVVGDGPALLLVHAGVADSRMWARQVADLRVDHQVITADLRGYGETPLAPGTKYWDADDLLELLDVLRVERAAVVAASYGAGVVLQAATKQPDRFTRLVLLAPPVDGVEPTEDLRAFWAEENRLLEAGDVDGATALNVETWLGPEADDDARVLLSAMQRHAFEIQLAAGDTQSDEYPIDPAAITAPVKLFSGAHDLQFFTVGAAELAKALPDVEHVELPWAGHLPTLERPEEGTALIRDALA